MLKVLPDLLKLDAVRNLFRFSNCFSSDKLRQVFSFETLLIGGNPMSVPAIYAMIHFSKTWGVHCMGGTGALVQGFVKKFEELGGTMRLNAPVDEILVTTKTARRPVASPAESREETQWWCWRPIWWCPTRTTPP